MAINHLVVWPHAAVNVKGKRTVFSKGDELPDGVTDVDLANLVIIGAVVASGDPDAGTPDESKAPAPDSVKGILATVGDDKELAAAALEAEKAKGDDARPSLVEKLEKIAGA